MSPTDTQVVTAVIVAHDGAAWIPHVVAALAGQTRPVQRVVGVDTGSRDRSGAMLAESLGRGAVFGMDRDTGYGGAVHQALRHRAAKTHVPSAAGAVGQERAEWVWLLHDDCEPEPDALEQLLAGAAADPAVAVVGPKVLDWSDREVLLEVGVTIDRACRRTTGIEPREVDQGQHDGDRDVLAVSSAGMLIRRDVWEQVGGFDPGMRLYREDVDFCWRVQAAGYRVRVITDAVVYHVEASARNRRAASAAPRRGREDRGNALRVLLGNLPGRQMLAALAGNLVLSVLRTMFFLVAKRPGAASDEVSAFVSVAGHPWRLIRVRRARAHGRRAAYGRLRADLPPGRSLRRLAEFASASLSRSLPVDMVGSHHATEDPSDDDSLLVDSGIVQRLLTSPGVLLFLALTVVTLVAARSLLAGTPLGGGALVPAWGGASGLWQEYLQGFHPVGLGTAATTPPYVAVLAALATVLGGKPWLAVDVILIGCVPVAGVTAYLATRRVTRFVPARLWAAASYALLPVGMGAIATGRLGTAVVLMLLPLIGVLAARIFTQPRRRARRAAWATGLAVAVAAAFVPLIWPISVIAVAAGVVAFRRRMASALNTGIVAVVPALLLAPWTLNLFTQPSQMFLEAGLQRAGLASPDLPARSLLLLSPGGPGLPPVWVTAGLLAAAVVVLVVAGRRRLVLAGWGVSLIGLLVAAMISRVLLTPASGGALIPAWPGVALAAAAAGLLLAVAAAADAVPGLLRSGGWHAPRGLAVLGLAAVTCSAPLLAAASWLTTGVRGPVAPVAGPVLPEFVSVSSATGLRLRTLVLRVGRDGTITYSVLRAGDPLLGSPQLPAPPAARRALELTVAALAAPHGADVQPLGRALAAFDIGYVLLPAPVNPGLARMVNGVNGIRAVSQTSAFELWRVADTTARVTVTEPGGTVVTLPSAAVTVTAARAPAAGGTLVLAEPAGGWTATLNGRPLTPLPAPVHGWAQGFRLPPGGGSLSIGRSQFGRDLAVALEAIALLVVAGLGLPGARVAGEAVDPGDPVGSRRTGTTREAPRGRRAARRRGAGPAGVPAGVRAAPRGPDPRRPVPVGGDGGPAGRMPAGAVPAGNGPAGNGPAGNGPAGNGPGHHGHRAPGHATPVPAAGNGHGDDEASRRGRGHDVVGGRHAPPGERDDPGLRDRRTGPAWTRADPGGDPGPWDRATDPRWSPAERGGDPGRRDRVTGPGWSRAERRPSPDQGGRRDRALPPEAGRRRDYQPGDVPGSRQRPAPPAGAGRRGRAGADGGGPAPWQAPVPREARLSRDVPASRAAPAPRDLPRGRLPGDDETLPPLPPLPRLSPRRRRSPDDHPTDGGESAGSGAEPRYDRGGPDW